MQNYLEKLIQQFFFSFTMSLYPQFDDAENWFHVTTVLTSHILIRGICIYECKKIGFDDDSYGKYERITISSRFCN